MGKKLGHWFSLCSQKIAAILLIAAMVGVFVGSANASAEGAIFKVQAASISSKTDGVSAKVSSFDDSKIIADVTFNDVGDKVAYRITIKNTGKKDHLISSIIDDNQNQHITYSYSGYENLTVAAGESFVFDVTAKYATATTDSLVALNTLFTISFDGGEESIGIAPSTEDDIEEAVVIAAISSLGLIVAAVILVKSHKKAAKIAAIAIAASAVIAPVSVRAASLASNSFALVSDYHFAGNTNTDITISISDENVWKPSKTVAINYFASGNGIANQYSLDNGATWQDYTAPIELKKNNIPIIARTLDADGKNISDAKKTATKIDPVVPTVSITLGGSYYSGQALDLSSITTYTAGESGATLRWFADGVELSNLSDTYLIDRLEEQYEVTVKAVATSGAGLSGEDESETIIIKYARWDDYLIGDLTRNNIGSVQFVAWSDMPGNEDDWTDISVNHDGAVKEVYILDATTNLYNVYIASPYGYSRYKDDSMGSNFLPGTDANINHITSASQGGVNSCQDHYGMFAYMPNLKTIDFKYLDMFNINDMSCMFNNIDFNTKYWNATSALTTITWGEKFNTVNVTNMSFAFAGLVNLRSLDLSSFDTSSVIGMKGLFAKNETLQSLELANWDTSKVRDFSYVFYSTPNLKNYDITNWNTSSAVTLNGTFYGAGAETLNLSKWDVSNVKTFYQLFEDAENLKTVNLTGWNTSNVIDMSWMFNRAGVTGLDLRSFDTSNVQRMGDMFSNTPNLTSIDVSNFDTSNVWDMNGMFCQTKIKELNLDNFNTEKVSDFGYFAWNAEVETINFRHLTFSSPNDFYCMFWNATKLKNIYVETVPTIPAGSRTTAMWASAGTNHFTVKTYND